MKLPAELRLSIYELVFTSIYREHMSIEIKNFQGPQPDLLATCKEICDDARPTFKNSVQNFLGQLYWFKTTIEYDPNIENNSKVIDKAAGPQNLPRAQLLSIRFASHTERGLGTCVLSFDDDGEGRVECRMGEVPESGIAMVSGDRALICPKIREEGNDDWLDVRFCVEFAYGIVRDMELGGDGFGN